MEIEYAFNLEGFVNEIENAFASESIPLQFEVEIGNIFEMTNNSITNPLKEVKKQMIFLFDNVIGSRSQGIRFEGTVSKLDKGKSAFDHFLSKGQKTSKDLIYRFLYIFRYYLFPFDKFKNENNVIYEFEHSLKDKNKIKNNIFSYHNKCVVAIESIYDINLSFLLIEYSDYNNNYNIECIKSKREKVWYILNMITVSWLKADNIDKFNYARNRIYEYLYMLIDDNKSSYKYTINEYNAILERQTRILTNIRPLIAPYSFVRVLIKNYCNEFFDIHSTYEHAIAFFTDYLELIKILDSKSNIEELSDDDKTTIDKKWKQHKKNLANMTIYQTKDKKNPKTQFTESSIWDEESFEITLPLANALETETEDEIINYIFSNDAVTYRILNEIVNKLDDVNIDEKYLMYSPSHNKLIDYREIYKEINQTLIPKPTMPIKNITYNNIKLYVLKKMNSIIPDNMYDIILSHAHITGRFDDVLMRLKDIRKQIISSINYEESQKDTHKIISICSRDIISNISQCERYLSFQSKIRLMFIKN